MTDRANMQNTVEKRESGDNTGARSSEAFDFSISSTDNKLFASTKIENSTVAKGFESAAKTLELTPKERAVGKEVLGIIEQGDLSKLQATLEKYKDNPDALTRPLAALNEGLSSVGVRAKYKVDGFTGVGDESFEKVGRLDLSGDKVSLQITTASKKLDNAQDNSVIENGYGKPMNTTDAFKRIQDKIAPLF